MQFLPSLQTSNPNRFSARVLFFTASIEYSLSAGEISCHQHNDTHPLVQFFANTNHPNHIQSTSFFFFSVLTQIWRTYSELLSLYFTDPVASVYPPRHWSLPTSPLTLIVRSSSIFLGFFTMSTTVATATTTTTTVTSAGGATSSTTTSCQH